MKQYNIGDRPTFTRTVPGNPYRVNALIAYPDGTAIAYVTVPFGDDYTASPPALDQAGTHTLRWNVYAESGDVYTQSADEEEFEVHPSPFADPFLEP